MDQPVSVFQSARNCIVRPATPDDVPSILRLIRELAEYERLAHEVSATEAILRENLFGQGHVADALIAEVDGRPVGFAVYFRNFSTFLGRPGLYLEDLYMQPEYRGRGIGQALLRRLAQIARERGCAR